MQPSFSLYDHAVHDDPFPTYAYLRDEAPVFRNDIEDFWALSRHNDVAVALADHVRFSSANGILLDPSLWGPQAERYASFLAMDPPRHSRMRALVSRAFSPRRIAALEPHIRQIARRHLELALESRSFDLVGEFATRLPTDVICELAGVPEGDRIEVRRLTDLLVHRDDGVRDLPAAGVEATLALVDYFAGLIDRRRRDRREDLVSALLEVADGDDRLTEQEILGVLFILVGAGNETTTNLISNAMYCVWRRPECREAAFARIEDWIEETLRLEAPAQGVARKAVEGFNLHGVTVPPQARVLLLIGSANRDDRIFQDPDRFDLDRDTNEKISFGKGRHFCLGSRLARVEAHVALAELTARIADFEVDEASARRVHSPYVRGFTQLRVTMRPC